MHTLVHTQATDVEPKFSTVGVQISPKPIHPSLTDLHKPSLFSGFPTFTYTVEDSSDIHKGARGIVMKCMVNASQVASRALDHGVPLLQRSSGTPLGSLDTDIADLPAAKDSRGCVDQRITLRGNLLIFAAIAFTRVAGCIWQGINKTREGLEEGRNRFSCYVGSRLIVSAISHGLFSMAVTRIRHGLLVTFKPVSY